MKNITIQEFFKQFPDDETCLNHLMETRFGKTIRCPKCKKDGKFHRIKKIPAYECQWCGYHIHPMAGTPFEASHTPLQKWFYAMYLFTTSRHGVSAKEIQRQLGVTYKTAWRMAKEIRSYMKDVDGDDQLSGHVEVDETFLGGEKHIGHDHSLENKSIIFGMLQRKGDVMTRVIPDRHKPTIMKPIKENIKKGSTISSDELRSYRLLKEEGYKHGTVRHKMKQYVKGIHHVNSLEGFWSILKRSIKSTHIHVSKKYLPLYLGEFEFRYNMRTNPSEMFPTLLKGF